MIWKWLILTGFVKLILLLAPVGDISGDFNLEDKREEAKEFAAAKSTKAMLYSTPILLALQTLNQSTQVCRTGINGLRIGICIAIFVVIIVFIPEVRTSWLRGYLASAIWFVLLMVLETVFNIYALMPIAKMLCA
jgi:hypothetical protein